MKRFMILMSATGHTFIRHECVMCPPIILNDNIDVDEVIPQFYSAKHAYDEGWRLKPSHIYGPDKGWLCPECAVEAG